MSYTVQYAFPPAVLEEGKQRILAPVIGAFHIHSIKLFCNGLVIVNGFRFNHPWLYLDVENIGYQLELDDQLWFEADYFYKTENFSLLNFVVDSTYTSRSHTEAILSTHFIDGHFAFDNGLYKEAVSNFGTIIEALVNTTLDYCRLENKIDKDPKVKLNPRIREYMHEIRTYRNKVHPHQIKDFGNTSREQASHARSILQEILYWFYCKNEDRVKL